MTMTATKSNQSDAVQPQVSALARTARYLYLLCAALFAGGVVLQVFFAGAALLVNAQYLLQHRMFAHVLELLTFLVPIVALFARLPRRLALLSWLPLLLFLLQYVFLYAVPAMRLPTALRALHAVNALAIFWIALHLVKSAWQITRSSSASQPQLSR